MTAQYSSLVRNYCIRPCVEPIFHKGSFIFRSLVDTDFSEPISLLLCLFQLLNKMWLILKAWGTLAPCYSNHASNWVTSMNYLVNGKICFLHMLKTLDAASFKSVLSQLFSHHLLPAQFYAHFFTFLISKRQGCMFWVNSMPLLYCTSRQLLELIIKMK